MEDVIALELNLTDLLPYLPSILNDGAFKFCGADDFFKKNLLSEGGFILSYNWLAYVKPQYDLMKYLEVALATKCLYWKISTDCQWLLKCS